MPDRNDPARPWIGRLLRATLGAALALTTAACSTSMFAPGATVPVGIWGGNDASINVTSTGAQATFDCAHGTLNGPLAVDADGRFDVSGSYTVEGGPTPESEQSVPARYSGQLQGLTMALAVSLTGTGQVFGGFTLTLGRTPNIMRCQ